MLLARRNLTRDHPRFALSVLGVALSVMLILLLGGYLAGIYRQSAAYLDHALGSVVVAETGIRDFLGTSSVLPAGAADAVRGMPGVARVVPVTSQFVIFESHGRKEGFFLIGYDRAAGGGPWDLASGREPAVDGEIVIDRVLASQHGIAIRDRLRLLDRDLTVVGLSNGTTFWSGSLAFAPVSTLESLLRAPGIRSFLLVTPAAGTGSEALRDGIRLTGAEALLKEEMIRNDRKLLARVYDAPLGLMVGIAFFVGVLVVGLVIYTATIERRREYGALKAIGARNRVLYRIVTAQAFIAAVSGAFLGVALAFVVGAALMAWRPQFVIAIDPSAVGVVVVGSLLMALLAAFIPTRAIARLAPAEVLRG